MNDMIGASKAPQLNIEHLEDLDPGMAAGDVVGGVFATGKGWKSWIGGCMCDCTYPQGMGAPRG